MAKNVKSKKAAKPAAKKASKIVSSVAAIKAAPTVQKVRSASKPRNVSSASYTQSEVVENIRAFCGLIKRSQAKEIVDDIAAFIKDSLKKGYKIPLLGLGKMYVRQSKARVGRNPATGEEIQIPAKKRIRFTAAKALKEAVL
jgi:DNA-binding protein HU-beta